MSKGFNTNIVWQGVGLHVQTEYQSEQDGLVETLVFKEGHIIFTHRNPYFEEDAQALGFVIENQHKRILTLIKNGLIEQLLCDPKQPSSAGIAETGEKSPEQDQGQQEIDLSHIKDNEYGFSAMLDHVPEEMTPSRAITEDSEKLGGRPFEKTGALGKSVEDVGPFKEKYVTGSLLKQTVPKDKDRILVEKIRKYWSNESGEEQSNWKKLESVLEQMISLMNDVIMVAVVTENGLPLALEHGSDIVFPTKELTRLFKNIMQFREKCTSPTLDFGQFEELHGYTTNINFMVRYITEKVFLILFATKQANLGKMKTIITQYSLLLKVIFD